MPPVPETGQRLALLIATSVYSDPDLRQLRAPGRDARELAEVLRDPRIGGFDVQVLANAASGEVQEGIEDFCTDRHPGDQLLIYLSCHGVLDTYGRLYYATVNTRRQRLAATAVAAAWLNERLEDCRARRQILVLDCCHSGAFAKGAKGDSDLELQHRFEPQGRGRVVLTASRSTEYSFEGGQASGEGVPSVFTHAVVNGLRTGDADRDKDGLITVTDLYQYVYDNVRAAESRQTPELWTYGAEGNLLVAYSIRGAVIEPVPLPEDLRITLESPRRRVRETAVAELAELLDSAGPGLALTAQQTLERIAEEDHPQVAELAGIAVGAPAGSAADRVRRALAERAHREEQARQEAARRQAEEQAQREAEEQAQREAEEQAQREAEEAARRQAEEPATPGTDQAGNAPLEVEPTLIELAEPADTPGGIHLSEEMPGQLRDNRSTRRRWGIPAAAALAVIAVIAVIVAITAIHSPTSPSPTPPAAAATAFNAALTRVVNPSASKGGTLAFGLSSTPDSTDPGNTYENSMWNFSRLYTMPLMTYKSCPGACGLQVVPDLATGPGVVSDNGLTWTYHIQPDVRFEDGSTVTSADVKYAVERTFDRTVLALGPSYFASLLGGNAATYPGPYKDRSKNLMGLTAVTTPNPTTVVFHLAHPFADFDYVVAIPQTAPVPPDHDTGANYQVHPWSTGPYKFQNYQLNKQLTLVPNAYWNPATDPNAKQLASKITVTMNMNADDIDNQLLAGDLSADMTGAGVQAAARAKILSSASLKAQADNPFNGAVKFAYLNTKVPPLNNVHCRMAIEYATNKINQQAAYGGPYTGGSIASTVAPPNLIGQKPFDLYEATTKPNGDITKARAELAACGHASGFTTGIAYDSDRPTYVAAARALQTSLAAAGIKATLHGYAIAAYYGNVATVPAYTDQHDLGILLGAWGTDWPDGYGFFYTMADGSAIYPAGNANIEQLNDPVVNSLLAKTATTLNPATRNSYTSQIDMQIMKDAAILPGVYSKSLLYRNPNLTNVYVQSFYGQYNYAVLGVK